MKKNNNYHIVKKYTYLIFLLLQFSFVGFCYSKIKNPTYTKSILPIFINKCYSCHHAGGEGNLSFDTYEKSKNLSKTIQLVINSNKMPPWKADVNYSHFENERILTVSEKKMINEWIKSGCLKGKGESSYQWKISENNKSRYNIKPNLVLNFPQKYEIKNDLKDKFVYIKIPFEIKNDTLLNCIEFIADNTKYVHHVNYEILRIDSSIDLNFGTSIIELDRNNNYKYNRYSIFKEMNLLNKDGSDPVSYYYGSWVPGMSAIDVKNLPIGINLPKKGVLLFDIIHYAPSSIKAFDSSSINLYYKAEKNVDTRFVEHIGIGSSTLNPKPLIIIKPNTETWITREYIIQKDFTLLYLNPHMHLLGKKFLAYALYKNDTIPLIKIDNWDFDWQELYELKKPLILKKGTKVVISGYYDNTIKNIRNPFNPPRLVSGDDGMQTSGEMLLLVLYGINYQKGDENLKE